VELEESEDMMNQPRLTKAEATILRFYRSIVEREHFCRSIKTIAEETKLGTRTVQRANTKFLSLGILSWVSGNSASWRPGGKGQANRYRFVLSGVEGSGITPAMVSSFRCAIRKVSEGHPNDPKSS
jgi:hypothetical protein